MNGEVHWLPVFVLMFGLCVLAAFAFVVLHWSTRYRWGFRTVSCPSLHTKADCVVKMDAVDGAAVDIERCSLLKDPDHVTCDRACLKRLNDR